MSSKRQMLVELEAEAKKLATWFLSEPDDPNQDNSNILTCLDTASPQNVANSAEKLKEVRLRVSKLIAHLYIDPFSAGFSFMGLVQGELAKLKMEKAMEPVPVVSRHHLHQQLARFIDNDAPSLGAHMLAQTILNKVEGIGSKEAVHLGAQLEKLYPIVEKETEDGQ